jgi:hypothetical protein
MAPLGVEQKDKEGRKKHAIVENQCLTSRPPYKDVAPASRPSTTNEMTSPGTPAGSWPRPTDGVRVEGEPVARVH